MEITRIDAGKGLRKFREKYGKTLEDIHKNTGISKATLIRVEKDVIPQAKTVFKLNQLFKSFPDD
jgi:transcriptional regulator with XRE-family HTH domain